MAKYEDDLAGLEFAEFDELFNMEMAKEMGLAGVSGAASILLATYGMQSIAKMSFLSGLTPQSRSQVMSGLTIVAGVAVGRGLYHYNRDAAMGVVGALGGLGLANLIGSFLTTNPLGAPLGALPEDMALSGDDDALSAYDYEALQGLGETDVQGHAGAFGMLADPSVTPEQLQGTMVAQETLGYAPYLS